MNLTEFLNIRTPERKILITDSVKNANRLVRKSKKVLFNVEIKTLRDIAVEAVAAKYAEEGQKETVRVLNDKACSYILYDVLSAHRPEFLPEESLDINTAAEFLNIINKIRLGIPTEAYKNDNPDKKLAQIKGIISLYEAYLEKNDLFDYARLLDVTEKTENRGNISYYAMESEYRTKKEEAVIKALVNDRYVTYKSGDLLENIEFSLAYGVENEVAAVADSIAKQQDKPLGEFAVYYTSEEYDSIIQSVFESKGIPCRLTSGVSASQTNLIGLMLNILNWAKDDYLYKSLKSVMSSPILRLDTEKASTPYAQYLWALDDSLVYGLKYYEKWLNKKENEVKDYKPYKEEEMTESEYEEYTKEERAVKLDFVRLMKELTAVFDNGSELPQLYKALFGFVKSNTNNRYFEEKKALYNRLNMAAGELEYYKSGNLSENIDVLIDFLSNLKINTSECTDKVLAVRLSAPEVLERKYNYFIGLSALQFNSKIVESPILSDEEIEKYLDDDKLKSSKVNDLKRNCLLDTLKTADSDAEVTVSSINYNTVEMQPATPAPVYIELLNLNGKDLPDKYFGYKTMPNNSVSVSKSVWDNLPAASSPRKIKRRYKEARNISASSLQNLLKCPQMFYLNKVIGLRDIEFKERNAAEWLDSKNMGTYCHSVLEKYVNNVIIEHKKKSFDENAYEKIFDEVFDLAEKEIFCDSATVRNVQKENIRGDLKKYIESMHTEFNSSGFMPIACEANFDVAPKPLSKDDWSDTINFHGIIDRIDKNSAGEYRVIDYKTGKYHNDEEDTYKQHIAYPLVSDIEAEKINPDDIKQFVYEYIFSKKDNEKRKVKEGEDLKTLTDGELVKLISVLKDKDYSAFYGTMSVDDFKKCEFCKFTDICNLRMGGE